MSELQTGVWDQTSPDALLITAVRQGDAAAFGVLFARHADAARTVVRQYVQEPSDVEDVVSDGFEKVLQVLQGGGGPDSAFRAYLFTVVRRLAFVHVDRGRRTQPTDEDYVFESAIGPLASVEEPTLRGFEDRTVAVAFQSLPERWQSVLWYTDIEGQTPAAVAPIFGLTANGVAALAYRAREGLRQAYLQQHLQGEVDDGCHRANALLGSYVRGGLSKRETATVEQHLDDCGTCRVLTLELTDVSQSMRGVVAPLVLGVAGLGALAGGLPLWGAGLATGVGAASAGAAGSSDGSASTGSAAPGAASATGRGRAKVLVGAGAFVALMILVAGATFGDWFERADRPGAVAHEPDVSAPTNIPPPSPTLEPEITPDPNGDADDGGPGPLTQNAPLEVPWAPNSGPGALTAPSVPGSGPAGIPADRPGDGAPPGPGPQDPGVPSEPQAPSEPSGPDDPDDPAEPPAPGVAPAAAEDVEVSAAGLVALNDAPLRTTVTNTSEGEASDVVVGIELPADAEFTTLASGSAGTGAIQIQQAPGGSVRSQEQAVTWDCELDARGRSATCAAEALAPGATTDIVLHTTYRAYGVESEQIPITVTVAGRTVERSIASLVEKAPAKLAVGVEEESALVVGQDGWLGVHVTNHGELGAPQARVELTLPEHLDWVSDAAGVIATRVSRSEAGGSEPRWTCAVVAESERRAECATDQVGPNPAQNPDATTRLDLAVRTAQAPTSGVRAQAFWDGRASKATATNVEPLAVELDVTYAPQSLTVVTDDPAQRSVAATVTVTNTSKRALDGASLGLDLPDGVTPVGGCEPGHDGDDGACRAATFGDLGAGESRSARVEFGVGAGHPMGTEQISFDVTGALAHGSRERLQVKAVSADSELRVRLRDFGPLNTFRGSVGVAEIGAPLLFCNLDDDRCRDAAAGDGSATDLNNDAHNMIALNDVPCEACAAPSGGVRTSSAAELRDVPPGAQIEYAELLWSANDAASIAADRNRAYLRVPGGEYREVTAAQAPRTLPGGPNNSGFYAASADVTEIVQDAGQVAGSWSVANIAIDPKAVGDRALYAGWSLVVVYSDPTLEPSEVTLYDGALLLSKDDQAKELAFRGVPDVEARIGVVAWEGDRGITGDSVQLNGTQLEPRRFTIPEGGGVPVWAKGEPDNAFDSTATGFRYPNSLGVDAKAFQPAPLAAERNVLELGTEGDLYILSALTVQVPLD